MLAWIVAPWLRDQIGGDDPFAEALLICLTAGLIWQFVLVLIMLRRELGTLEWPRVRDALWLRAPRDPKTGHVGGRVWWWALLFVVLLAIWTLVPTIRDPAPGLRRLLGLGPRRGFLFRRVGLVRGGRRACHPQPRGEELLFRGLLLPRMRDVFGRGDWVANGVLFAIYHLHVPWVILNTFVEGIFLEAYPSRRFQSAWMGIIVHSIQSVLRHSHRALVARG